ncbi:MAG: DnaJ domain-containing protein [Limisphaerales bacterium]
MDHFAALGQPRLPWIDLEALKERFQQLSMTAHPDRFHNGTAEERAAATARYAELNAAHNCLRDPKARVQHLLELELGAPPANLKDIPAETMDLFMEVGQVCREADRIVAAKVKASSPLLQAQWFEPAMACSEKLNALLQRIHLRRETLLTELHAMNAVWEAAPPPASAARAAALPLRRLEEMGRDLSYLSRWSGQLQERIGLLSI